LTSSRYENSAFDGTGSKRAGGRWNSPGRAVVYTSEHPAVAVLELLVHVKRAQLLRDSFVMIPAEVPDYLVNALDPGVLPPRWDAPVETRASTDIGDAWYDLSAGVALRVPSVVLPGQFNVLLNPFHPHWDQVTPGTPEPFLFDLRLAGP
jgi:RES domain-containing protein